MKWLIRLFKKSIIKTTYIPAPIKVPNALIVDKEEPCVPTLNIDGSFIKKDEFEAIWISKNVNRKINRHGKLSMEDKLSDNDYIDYYLWQDQNFKEMYKKHLPGTGYIRGKNPNIIFHGGCLGCLSQRLHGIDRCKGCSYFRWRGDKSDLSIEGEEASRLSGDDFIDFLKGK
tara:strand:+ start:6570 stop:7085 length:516 start_codon:yes stop_codon:yes gene_type:complete